MKMRAILTKIICLLGILLASLPAAAQLKVVDWSARIEPADVRAGESAQVIVSAKIKNGWHIYSIGKDGGPTATKFELSPDLPISTQASLEPTPSFIKDALGKPLAVQEGDTDFAIPFSVDKASGVHKGKIKVTFQPCNDKSCLLFNSIELPITLAIQPGEARPDRIAVLTTVPKQPPGHIEPKSTPAAQNSSVAPDEFATRVKTAQNNGILAYMGLAFTMGLLALLTPCVFPMIPITVSFFAKKTGDGEKRVTDYRGATWYSVGIISTFTGLGVLISVIFGASGVQDLATNPYVNAAMAILFIALAASLFGAFEIMLPQKLVNSANKGTKKSGFIAPFLMGLTFTMTSFTCTVPFVGTLLAGASQGSYLFPVMGMLAFSAAFALPFFLLALFPQYLARLPKSGSWLSTVKAFMGFLELAAALKFISNVDLVWQLGWLTRSIFLGIWATIAIVGGLYLWGWLLLGHDPVKPKIGFPRRVFALGMVFAGVYCWAAIDGAPLGTLASLLPPDPYPGRANTKADAIAWEHNFDAAVAKAKTEKKLVFINFTGVTCTNCRWMEFNMFPRKPITEAIKQYVPLELYTDRKTTEDNANQKLREKLTGVPSNPVYVVVDGDGRVKQIQQGAEQDETKFLSFLERELKGKVASK